ncbi:MAG: hypothetical protein J5674_06550 [Candidatus Methanomethylophilaceae archaeon]|nr:hypothetical protein [Candidatus Methanomethylophilaceae archaeon]
MGGTEADRFLNCVMRRSESDSLFRVGVVLAVSMLCPLFVAFVLYSWYEDQQSDMELGVGLISWTVIFYVLYLEVRGIALHRMRDAEWMGSLAAYARSRGRGTEEMDGFLGSSGVSDSGRALAVSRAAFIFLFAFNVFLALWMRASGIDEGSSSLISGLMPSLMVVELSVTAAYLFKAVVSHDSLQSEFTSLFVDAMGEDLGLREPMRTSFTGSRVRLWPHAVLLIVTLGLYSTFFNLLVVHKMNVHLTSQWAYEEGLVAAMAEAEGASGVRKGEAVALSGAKAFLDLLQRGGAYACFTPIFI